MVSNLEGAITLSRLNLMLREGTVSTKGILPSTRREKLLLLQSGPKLGRHFLPSLAYSYPLRWNSRTGKEPVNYIGRDQLRENGYLLSRQETRGGSELSVLDNSCVLHSQTSKYYTALLTCLSHLS